MGTRHMIMNMLGAIK